MSAALLAPLSACGAEPESLAPVLLRDATPGSGLADVRHYAAKTPSRFLPETMSGGVAVFDANDDGLLDIYLVNARPIEGSVVPPMPPANRLFVGVGALRFEEALAGLEDEGFGMGVAIGDADGDGALDVYVTNWGPNVLFRREVPGRFAAAARGVEDKRWSVSAGFFDADRDGDLDLYVVNYLRYSLELQAAAFTAPGESLGDAYPNPDKFDGVHDALYRNDGRGHFADASEESGVRAVLPGKGLGVVFADFDDDGDSDVYVANDSSPNFLFVNDGAGRFQDLAGRAACAFNRDGISEASMGVDVGDIDDDGRLDVVVTHLELETNTLYVQSPGDELRFRDRTREVGLALPSLTPTGFGVLFQDFDADGWLDLFVANGGLHDNITRFHPDREYAQQDTFLRGTARGRFVAVDAGPHFQTRHVGRGAASGDLDGDGDPDVVIANSDGALLVLENVAADDARWIALSLHDPGGPTEGARVTLHAAGRRQVRDVGRARSYASASDAELFFGLGTADAIDAVEVRWPSGETDRFTDLVPNRRQTLTRR